MSEKPILLSTPMVQAVMDDRKNKTRRLNGLHEINKDPDKWNFREFAINTVKHCLEAVFVDKEQHLKFIRLPWEDQDVLWVKETWKVDSVNDHEQTMAIDFRAIQDGYNGAEVICKFQPDRYKKFRKFYQKNGWQSGLFMPREAARLTPVVKNVRVERLQEMSDVDAWAEGIEDDIPFGTVEAKFKPLWDSLNSKRGFGWNTNPWVWVIDFERTEAKS